MLGTPKGLRLHIGFFGKRNAGKSSMINALTNQAISIVSSVPGTTTDPVEKSAELSPIGPVVYIDTAGIDDVDALGKERVKRSLSVLEWMDLAIIVLKASSFDHYEKDLLAKVKTLNIPALIVVNQIDIDPPSDALIQELQAFGHPVIQTAAKDKVGIDSLRQAIISALDQFCEPDAPLVGDLVNAGDTVLLVVPIDTGAPKGRLILPQVQAIRELLDQGAKCIVIQEDRVKETLEELKHDPKLIMTDSQVIKKVAADSPARIPLTSFSTQMAYAKCDLLELARGTAALSHLKGNDRVLICETCSHHPQKDDIGRLKIPRWLRETISPDLQIDIAVGKDFPTDLKRYKVIIQCGGCVVTRRHMLARLRHAMEEEVPMTNYGLTISYLQGVLERVLACHPEALKAYLEAKKV